MPQEKPKAVSAEYNSKGQYVGSKAAARKDKVIPIEVESEEDRNDRNELANAAEWDKPGILKRQAAKKAAKEAKAAASPSPSPKETPKEVSDALAKATPTPKK